MLPDVMKRLLLLFLAAGLPALPRAATVDVGALENLRPARPVIPARTFTLTDFGAVGDGRTLNTTAFQRAIAAVERAGGGRLVVPPGVFRTGSFTLCSSLELHLAEGAVIEGPPTFTDYGLPEPETLTRRQAAALQKPAPLLSGRDLHDVALTGPGVIDGNGAHWWAWSERAARRVAGTEPARTIMPRPHLVVLEGVERLLVSGITLRNSPMFHLVPRRVHDLTVEHVTVRAPWDGSAPNTDALDPGPGARFWIHHCDIDTGDDDIVIKSGGTAILIEDCLIRHGHGISIGSETTAGVDGMLVRNCTLEDTDNGIRIKSMRGAGGLVRNVRYTNLTLKHVENAIVLQLDYVDNNRPDFKGDPAKVPAIRDILIDRVIITGSRQAGRIVGLPDSPIRGITLRDVFLQAEQDLVIKDSETPVFERVTRDIRPGVAPPERPGEH
jgi:polygalacturonase